MPGHHCRDEILAIFLKEVREETEHNIGQFIPNRGGIKGQNYDESCLFLLCTDE